MKEFFLSECVESDVPLESKAVRVAWEALKLLELAPEVRVVFIFWVGGVKKVLLTPALPRVRTFFSMAEELQVLSIMAFVVVMDASSSILEWELLEE